MRVLLFSILILVCLAACVPSADERPLGVQFPADYRETFDHYATVDRRDGMIRDLYVAPENLNRIRRGRTLPEGTRIVIEAYEALRDDDGELVYDDDGRLIKDEMLPNVHVAEKRSDWTEADFDRPARSGDWNFGSYEFSTGERFDEPLNACFNCHNATPHDDFTYSLPQLLQYAANRETQYFYCDLPGRTAC